MKSQSRQLAQHAAPLVAEGVPVSGPVHLTPSAPLTPIPPVAVAVTGTLTPSSPASPAQTAPNPRTELLRASAAPEAPPTTTPALAPLQAPEAPSAASLPTPPSAQSVSGDMFKPLPSPIAHFLARLQDEDINVIEAALVHFRHACLTGDHAAIESALIEQGTLLNAVGSVLITNIGISNTIEQKQVWANLGLRSLEMSRKSLELAISSRGRVGRPVGAGTPPIELEVASNEHGSSHE